MVPSGGDGRSPAPIDSPILEFLRSSLSTAKPVDRVYISDADGHLELVVELGAVYYPPQITEATLGIRWYTNDDFKIHYQENRAEDVWMCRWDRHPNPHNTRDHFHPPPVARAKGEDASWPDDHRDVLKLILEAVEERIAQLWND